MKIFTRLILFIVLASILSLTIGAASAQDEPVTLDLWMFLDDSGFLPAVVDAFHAKYRNITVQITDILEGEYVTKVDTAILAGEPPDIGFPYAARWIKAGYVLPIDEAMSIQGINVEDYNAGAISR